MKYKPVGWDKIYKSFGDDGGAYTGIFVDAFSNVINSKLLAKEQWPTEAKDYLRPEFKGKLIVPHPTDDDAVVFWFKQVVDKYGWSFVADFARQDPIYVRGTQAPTDFVEACKGVATFTTDGGLTLGRHRIPLRAKGGSLRCLGATGCDLQERQASGSGEALSQLAFGQVDTVERLVHVVGPHRRRTAGGLQADLGI